MRFFHPVNHVCRSDLFFFFFCIAIGVEKVKQLDATVQEALAIDFSKRQIEVR